MIEDEICAICGKTIKAKEIERFEFSIYKGLYAHQRCMIQQLRERFNMFK